MGLSLWLVPDDPREKRIIMEQMDKLRERIGQSRSSAPFSPHVTLLTGIDCDLNDRIVESIWTKALDGLQRWKRNNCKEKDTDGSIKCNFSRVMTNGVYFQCILIALEKEETLLSLNAHMREALSLQDQPEYFPHLSLLYSSITADQAETYIDEMSQQGICRNTSSKGEFDFGSESNQISSVTLSSLELWNTNGSVSEWINLKKAAI